MNLANNPKINILNLTAHWGIKLLSSLTFQQLIVSEICPGS